MKRTIIVRAAFGLAMVMIFASCYKYPYQAYSGPERDQSEIGILYIPERDHGEGVYIVDVDGKTPDNWWIGVPWQKIILFLPGQHTLRAHYRGTWRSWPTEYITYSTVPKTLSFDVEAGRSYKLDFKVWGDDWRLYILPLDFPIFHVDKNGKTIITQKELVEFSKFYQAYLDQNLDHGEDVFRIEVLRERDGNGDGKISESEFAGYENEFTHQPVPFGSVDKNGDGFITSDEFAQWVAFRLPRLQGVTHKK